MILSKGSLRAKEWRWCGRSLSINGDSLDSRSPHKDYAEMLAALSAEGAEFVVVGAYALGAHGRVRATKDIDILVRPSGDNAPRVWRALVTFGAPLRDLDPADLSQPDLMFQIGMDPVRIGLLTSIVGVEFDEAWRTRVFADLGGITVPVLSREMLIKAKRAAGRLQDLADLEALGETP